MFTAYSQQNKLKILLPGFNLKSSRKPDNKFSYGIFSSLNTVFFYAGIDNKEQRKIFFRVFLEIVLIALFAIFFIQVKILFLIVPLLLFEYYKIITRITNRAKSFEKDYTALLLSLASSLRTGMDPLVTLINSSSLFFRESEMYKEVKKLKEMIEEGKSEEFVIKNFAIDIKHPDIALFRAAFILARKEGTSLSECLQRLAKVTRQRQSFRRKIASTIAMQKLSALGIAGCTVVIGVFQYTTNPAAIQMAWEHSIGFKILIASVVLIAAGVIWMMRMAKTKI